MPMGGKSVNVPCAGRKLYLRRSEPTMHRHVHEDKRRGAFVSLGTVRQKCQAGFDHHPLADFGIVSSFPSFHLSTSSHDDPASRQALRATGRGCRPSGPCPLKVALLVIILTKICQTPTSPDTSSSSADTLFS